MGTYGVGRLNGDRRRRKVKPSRILGALVCGIVIGAVGVMSLPGAAHHAKDERRLKNRVARLEAIVSEHSSRIPEHTAALDGIREELDALRIRTSKLDRDTGAYTGEILNRQVVVPLTTCQHLDDAVFGDDPNDGREVAYLGCVRGPR